MIKKEKGTPACTLIFNRLSVAFQIALLNGLSGNSATIFSTILFTPGNLISTWENLDNFSIYKPKLIFHTAAIPLAKIDNLNANEAKTGSVDTTTNILECVNFYQSRKYWFYPGKIPVQMV